MNNVEEWVWFSECFGKGLQKSSKLLLHFGSAEYVYNADRNSYLSSGAKLTEADLEKLCDKNLDGAKKIISECQRLGIRIITRNSPEYPKRLLEIFDAPFVLYAKGEPLSVDGDAVIAVVGTRRASAGGCSAAKKIAEEIALCGGVLCSGMARGIDTLAMDTALQNGGRVIGVLGCGPDICYPPENKELLRRVSEGGTILSEYPPKTAPGRNNFPKRNRIISALSLGTVVIEAPEKSGALITARDALEQNRDVFAVPSGIFEDTARGSNALIRDGATPIFSGYDVMSEYAGLFPDKINLNTSDISPKKEKPSKEESSFTLPENFLNLHSSDEQSVLLAISSDTLRADEIAAKTGFMIAKVLSLLTLLEIRGSVVQLPGNRFKIKKF